MEGAIESGWYNHPNLGLIKIFMKSTHVIFALLLIGGIFLMFSGDEEEVLIVDENEESVLNEACEFFLFTLVNNGPHALLTETRQKLQHVEPGGDWLCIIVEFNIFSFPVQYYLLNDIW